MSKYILHVVFILCVVVCTANFVDGADGDEWPVVRSHATNLEKNLEDSLVDIKSVSASSNLQHITVCDSSGTVNFYRVLMYPNLYPYTFSHLYFGKLNFESEGVMDCHLSGDQSYFYALEHDSHKKHAEGRIKTFCHAELGSGVDSRDHILKPGRTSVHANAYENITGFHMVHPRDHYDDIWVPSSIFSDDNSQFLFTTSYLDNGACASLTDTSFTYSTAKNKLKLSSSTDGQTIGVFGVGKEGSEGLIFSRGIKNQFKNAFDGAITPNGRIAVLAGSAGARIVHETEDHKWIEEPEFDDDPKSIIKILSDFPCKCDDDAGSYSVIIQSKSTIRIWQMNSETFALKLVASYSTNAQIMSFDLSSDLLVLAVVEGSNLSRVRIFRRENWKETVFKSAGFIDNSIPINGLYIYAMQHYHVIFWSNNQFHVGREPIPTVPLCVPQARITSFYEPIPPLYEGECSSVDINVVERDGILLHPIVWTGTVLAVIVGLYASLFVGLENSILHRISTAIRPRTNINIGNWLSICIIAVIFILSIFEILFQPAFVNDWPAHLHHVEQWVVEGTSNYREMMHYHGPNTYPGGFNWLYAVLYFTTGGSLQVFQLIWAGVEALHSRLLYKLFVDELKFPAWVAILPILSNRLHLYNVRVVINDFPSIVMITLVLWLASRKQWMAVSALYSTAVSTKLNFVFYGPGLLMVFLYNHGVFGSVPYFALMGVLQIIFALPFIATDPMSYVKTAFDLSRTLLWEKTRNMKFLGRLLYANPLTNHILLLTTILMLSYCMYSLMLSVKKITRRSGNEKLAKSRWTVMTMIISSFVFIPLARGLYTPFMCWYFYVFPAVMYFARLPVSLSTLLWLSHEVLFRFFGSHEIEIWTTFVYFCTNVVVLVSLLRSLSARGLDESSKKKQ